MAILISNNPLADTFCRDKYRVEYCEEPLLSLLIRVRDRVHTGSRLMTHPLSGSVKPNENPYKSVLVVDEYKGADPQSVQIIEECIATARKFEPVDIPDSYLADLQMIDLSLIQFALEKKK